MNCNMMLLFICTLKRKGLEWNVVLVMMYPLLSYLCHMGKHGKEKQIESRGVASSLHRLDPRFSEQVLKPTTSVNVLLSL